MNKKRFTSLGSAIVVATFCLLARSAFSFPFTETFNYPLTNLGWLTTNLNPEGNAWFPCGTNGTTGTTDEQVTNFTLTYPGLLCPATKSLYFQSSGYTERVAIAPPVISTNTNTMVVTTNNFTLSSGTIYYSFVFMITNLNGNSGNGGFICGFNNTVGAQATQPTTVGSRLYIRPSSLGITGPYGLFGYEIGIGKDPVSPVNATWSTNQYAGGGGAFAPSTNFIVASYTFLGGATNDYSQLWINPPTNTFGAALPPTADLVSSNTNNITIQTFMFRQGNAEVPTTIASDLRIGTNWFNVTPSSNTNTPPPPPTAEPLHIVTSSGNAIISWATNSSGFRLEGTPTLIGGSNAWTNVTALTNVVGTNYTVTDPISGKNYYRLIYP